MSSHCYRRYVIFLKHKLVSTFEPKNILMHFKDKTIIHDSNVPLQSFSIATFLLKFFSFSFRFSILLIKVMKMHNREIFKNPNFLYTYDFTSAIKITSPKTNTSLNTVSLISNSNELQPYIKQNNLNWTKLYAKGWLRFKLRFIRPD